MKTEPTADGGPQLPLAPGLRAAPKVCGGAVATLGVAVLLGWWLGVPLLKSILPGIVSMKANTALSFALTGAALLLLSGSRADSLWARIGHVLALSAALIAALTLSQYVVGWNLGIDELLCRDDPSPVATPIPGRMAPTTAVCFMLLGVALTMIGWEWRRGFRPAEALAAAPLVLGVISVAEYVIGAPMLYDYSRYNRMALHTASGFAVLSLGVLLAQPAHGWLGALRSGVIGPGRRRPLATAMLFLVLVLAGGGWFYHAERTRLHQQAVAQLEMIGETKVRQIVQWRAERLADAAVLSESPFLRDAVARWLADPTGAAGAALLARCRSLQTHNGYSNVLVTDPHGQVRLSLSKHVDGHASVTAAVAQSLSEHRPVFADLHTCEADSHPHLNVVAPLLDGEAQASRPVAAIVLVCDARQFLFPLVQSWPTPSQTAETLLVRRDGDKILFLNDLRHRSGTALTLRLPLDRPDLPAALAVLGRSGVSRGLDYRGEKVLSVALPVPDSPWFMVAKIDEAEAFSVWRSHASLIMVLILCLVATVTVAGLAGWQQARAGHLQALYQAEAARRESEARHLVTLMSIGDGVIVTDALGQVTLMNPVAEALTGWRCDEAAGAPMADVFRILNEETRQTVENPLVRVLSEGAVVGLANHTLLVARDGTERPIADSGAPVRDDRGAICGAVIVFRDQTEAHLAEAQKQRLVAVLQASRDELAAVYNHAPVMMCMLSADRRVLDANETFRAFAGLPKDEVYAGRACGVFGCTNAFLDPRGCGFGSACRDCALRQAIADTAATGVSHWQVEHRLLVERDGVGREVVLSASTARLQTGTETRVLLCLQDVTERSRAAAERERLATAIEQAAEMIVITDAEGRIQYTNPAFETVTGYTRAEVLGRTPSILRSGQHDEGFYRGMWSTIRAGKTWQGRIVNQRKDGSRYTEEATISPVRDATGAIVSYVAVKRDITRELGVEAQLAQAQRMESVGRLAGGVAHDFNNLLMGIMGYLDLCRDELPADHPVRAWLDEATATAQRSANLTRQLLAFARKQVIAPRVLDLNDTVAGMLALLHRLIGEDIDLAWVPGLDVGSVNMDPGQIDQILANLCVNARDAIGGVGKITIETENVTLDEAYCAARQGVSPGDYALLAVSDDGCGMEKEVLAHVFEPFFTTKGVGEGTGLGLATVYGIVRQNAGEITICSEAGAGTTVRVYLPRAAAAAPVEDRAQASEALPRGTETILLTEDEKSLRVTCRHFLEALGYTVLVAESAAAALATAESYSGEIHLLITDVVMPGMNGRNLAERLQASRPGLKYLFMSGYTRDVIAHRGVLDEGVQFIPKPFSRGDLARKVFEVLGQGHLILLHSTLAPQRTQRSQRMATEDR